MYNNTDDQHLLLIKINPSIIISIKLLLFYDMSSLYKI